MKQWVSSLSREDAVGKKGDLAKGRRRRRRGNRFYLRGLRSFARNYSGVFQDAPPPCISRPSAIGCEAGGLRRMMGVIGSGGRSTGGSAELHSVVARSCHPQTARISKRLATADALPSATRRYGRLQICATNARRSHPHRGVRRLRLTWRAGVPPPGSVCIRVHRRRPSRRC